MFDLTRLTLRRAREERLPQAAGGLTFTTLLSVVPLLVVSFAVFTRFPVLRRIGEAIRAHLLQGLLPPDIARPVLKHLAQFAANAGGLTLVGSLFVVASALLMMLNVENALNRIWQVKKNRPPHRRLGLYAVMMVLGLPLLGASLWATSHGVSASRALAAPSSARLALNLLPVLLGTIGLAGLFRFVPNAAVRWRDAILGGLLASVAFELGKRGLALYLLHVPTYRTVYGAFAPFLVFLVWVYFSWLVTLAAALVAASLPRAGRQPARRFSRA
jgi:membrane protein